MGLFDNSIVSGAALSRVLNELKNILNTIVAKLSGIESGAQKNVKPDWSAAENSNAGILNKPALPVTMVASGNGHAGGLVPDTPSVAGTGKFLCEDGTWKVPEGGGGTIPELPSNTAYLSNDNGDGIVPDDGIKAVTVTSAAAMTISPDVVTVIDGTVGTAAITLQVPNDNLAHVWDILMTTDSSVAITFAMSNSETILYPSGFSVGASKAIEVSVIGVGETYYLRYGEFA